MRPFRNLGFVTAIALLIGWPQLAHAQSAGTANTVEITEGPVISHTVAEMKVMNSSCVYGDHYHFELTPQGELHVHAPLICGKINAGGGEFVCFLGPELSCQSRKEYSPDPNSPYAVDSNGVHVAGKLYAWADPSQATALFAGIRAKATSKCERVVFEQSINAKRNPPSPPTPDESIEQAACKPVLLQVCSAARGGAAKLSNGKDVSVLCPR
jgi:hypothetical protein